MHQTELVQTYVFCQNNVVIVIGPTYENPDNQYCQYQLGSKFLLIKL